jgi:hypothetical protein
MAKKFTLKAKHKSKKGGLTAAGRRAYNRATGSNLKAPQPEGGPRKKSYCARSKGQMNDHNIDCKKTPDKRICLARRRWKCRKSLQKSELHPKQKLAMFLREHLDNKLALKAAEPTITKSQILTGGKGDTKDISDFDAKEVEMGMKVELEHTKDINVAKEIVADHLSEDPAYYSKLKGSGLADELNKAGRCWEGYEPTPGKKPYSKGSCRKIKKSEHEEKDSKIKAKQLNKDYVLSGGKMQKSYHQKLIKALACKCKEKELKKSISAMAIESGEYQGESLDSHHHNRIGNEYRAMAKQAHIEGNRHKAREYHEKALMHFRKADEMGFQEEEPLEKKISSKVAAAGLGLASALTGLGGVSSKTSELADKPPKTESIVVPQEKYPNINLHQAHQAISAIESSGGKNLVHKFLSKQGQRAVSQYGLLPTRVIELYARSPEFRNSLQGQMVGKIVDEHLSKFKTGNFYDTAAFIKNTPMHIKQNLFSQINEITKQKEHDDAIFHADRQHNLKNLSSVTDDPAELDIMATHSHHWHWPRTKALYEKGGIGAVINDEKSKEGNYVRKYNKQLPEGSPIKQKIEQFLNIPKKLFQPKKKESFHGS